MQFCSQSSPQVLVNVARQSIVSCMYWLEFHILTLYIHPRHAKTIDIPMRGRPHDPSPPVSSPLKIDHLVIGQREETPMQGTQGEAHPE